MEEMLYSEKEWIKNGELTPTGDIFGTFRA